MKTGDRMTNTRSGMFSSPHMDVIFKQWRERLIEQCERVTDDPVMSAMIPAAQDTLDRLRG